MQMKTRGWRFETDRIPPRVWSKVPYNMKELWTLVLDFSLSLSPCRTDGMRIFHVILLQPFLWFNLIYYSFHLIYLLIISPHFLGRRCADGMPKGAGHKSSANLYCLFNCLFLTARLSLSCLLSLSFSKSRQYLSVYSLSVCLSFCVCLPVPLFVCPSVCLPVWLSLCLSVSMYFSVCAPVSPSTPSFPTFLCVLLSRVWIRRFFWLLCSFSNRIRTRSKLLYEVPGCGSLRQMKERKCEKVRKKGKGEKK